MTTPSNDDDNTSREEIPEESNPKASKKDPNECGPSESPNVNVSASKPTAGPDEAPPTQNPALNSNQTSSEKTPDNSKPEELTEEAGDSQQESLPNKDTNQQRKTVRRVIIGGGIAAAVIVVLLIANALGAFHKHEWADATCTEPKTCITCGATEGDPLGHDYEEQDIPATCTEGGQRKYTCKRCGDTYSEPDGTPATGHTPGNWEIAGTKMVQRCTVCNETLNTKDVTRDDLAQAMSSDPVSLDDCHKWDSGSQYKALYPDNIVATITNHSDKVVRSVTLYVCCWDENGYPVTTPIRFGSDDDYAYLNMDDINIDPGETWSSENEGEGWALNSNSSDSVHTVSGCIESVTYMDRSTWTNKFADEWIKLNVDKPL